ncbi:MAG: YesL family protein [Acetatifactor sp.]|nr:YesL family protein [Acetatifactor sp.]
MKFLDIDGPLIQFLSKMADLMWLNILTMVCCIPIITAGASLTALNYMALKIVRGEECYITKGFFKSFKDNFGQSTIIWCFFLLVAAVIGTDYRIMMNTNLGESKVMKILIIAAAALVLFTFMFVFPVQAKFANSVRRTIWNAFVFSVFQFPRTVLMVVLYVIPLVMLYFFPHIFPLIFVFCFSLPALLSAKLYNNFFLSLEEKILAQNDGEQSEAEESEDERIFKDEIDESINLGQND